MKNHHGEKELRGQNRVPLSPINEGRFGRMFRRLPPAPKYDDAQLQSLVDTMHEVVTTPPGGWGSAPTIQEGGDNPTIPAAYTYLGQFIDHDLTFDPNSSLQQQNDVDALHDFRTPKFDLDNLYGSGPADEPFQYVPGTSPERLLVEPNVNQEEDLPRTSTGIAIIGDPRNDENIIVSQLQLIFLKFHNKIAAEVEADATVQPDDKFAETQRRVRWTYQQMVIHDYLVRLVGQELVDHLFTIDPTSGEPDFNLRFYRAKNNAYMPIEFSAAAFRFGHSQVRGVYDLSTQVTGRPIFVPGEAGPLDDLRGQRPLPQQWTIDWTHFVDLPGATSVQPSRLIDTHIVEGLFTLPGGGGSLPLRNLQRGQSMDLPSGQDVARLMGATVLSGADLGTTLEPTPLWYYILKEAELQQNGHRLGQVGGRIVAEVLLGMLQNDKTSWVNVDPAWKPTIPLAGGHVTLADIIGYANSPA
jgi:hypothetical protein